MQNMTVAILIALIAVANVSAQDADPVQIRLDAALTQYESTIDDAATQLLKSLDTARDSAQKRGDLSGVQSIDAEIKAFSEDFVLPKSISTSTYERLTQRAVARVQIAYENAIRDYTRDDKLPLATQLQAELDSIRKSGTVAVDPLRKHREWINADPPMNFSVIRRFGNSFQARFRVGENIDRMVSGTADSNSLSWKASDVVVRGGRGPGGDNTGTFQKDEHGFRIDIEWKDEKGNGGKFTLRPAKS